LILEKDTSMIEEGRNRNFLTIRIGRFLARATRSAHPDIPPYDIREALCEWFEVNEKPHPFVMGAITRAINEGMAEPIVPFDEIRPPDGFLDGSKPGGSITTPKLAAIKNWSSQP
jgi:hypothetical protein